MTPDLEQVINIPEGKSCTISNCTTGPITINWPDSDELPYGFFARARIALCVLFRARRFMVTSLVITGNTILGEIK